MERLSEEHGWLLPPVDTTGKAGPRPAVGERMRILPNHSCPVANLSESFTVLNADETTETWPVQARARVL